MNLDSSETGISVQKTSPRRLHGGTDQVLLTLVGARTKVARQDCRYFKRNNNENACTGCTTDFLYAYASRRIADSKTGNSGCVRPAAGASHCFYKAQHSGRQTRRHFDHGCTTRQDRSYRGGWAIWSGHGVLLIRRSCWLMFVNPRR